MHQLRSENRAVQVTCEIQVAKGSPTERSLEVVNCSLAVAIQQPHNQTNIHPVYEPYDEEQPLPMSCGTIQNVYNLLQPLCAPGRESLIPYSITLSTPPVLGVCNTLAARLQLHWPYDRIAYAKLQRKSVTSSSTYRTRLNKAYALSTTTNERKSTAE